MIKLKEILNEAVVKPKIGFAKKLLNSLKPKLLASGNQDKAIDILHQAFSEHWIGVKEAGSMGRGALYSEVGIIGAQTINTTKSGGSIVVMYIAENFFELLSTMDWNSFVNKFLAVLEHEYVHKYQIKKIPHNILSRAMADSDVAEEYLGNKHEVMAFALQAVRELQDIGFTRKQVLAIIRRPRQIPDIAVSETLHAYLYVFDSGDPILKRFLKYMYLYIT